METRKIKRVYHPLSIPEVIPQASRRRKVAAYARVSTSSDEQLNSVHAQQDYFIKHIQQHPNWDFAGVYADEGISGTTTRQREAFNRMIDDALAGKFDLIVTKSLSRFARNTVDTLNTIRKLKSHGIEVYFEKEKIYTLDSTGEFMITLLSSIAEEESRSISENVKWGYRKAFSEGRYGLAYKRFLGYCKGADGKPEVVPSEAVIIRWIYYLFLEGYSVTAIAGLLTASGIPTPGKKEEWEHATVKSILTNEKYYGAALLQKTFVANYITHEVVKNQGELPMYFIEEDHQGIISREVFFEVQDRLKAKNRLTSSYALFSRQICCPDCGGWYGPKRWHSTTYNDVVWECLNRHNHGSKCNCPHLYEELLIEAFRDVMANLLMANINVWNDCIDALSGLCDTSDIPAEGPHGIQYEGYPEENELSTWRLIIDKVVPYPGGKLVFHFIDGSILNYRMKRTAPKYRAAFTEAQKADIIKLSTARLPASKIAAKYNCSENTIWSVIRRHRKLSTIDNENRP